MQQIASSTPPNLWRWKQWLCCSMCFRLYGTSEEFPHLLQSCLRKSKLSHLQCQSADFQNQMPHRIAQLRDSRDLRKWFGLLESSYKLYILFGNRMESSRLSKITVFWCALDVFMEDHRSSAERSYDWQLEIAHAQLAFHGLDFRWEA